MSFNFKITRSLMLFNLASFLILTAGCSKNMDARITEADEHAVLVTTSDDTLDQIRSVIFDQYLNGQKLQSAETIRGAFSPDSVMLYSYQDDDRIYKLERSLEMHELVEDWAEQSSPNMDLNKFDILTLDVVDERIAVVTLKVEDRVFDALTLIKEGDVWKIASKVYIVQRDN